MSTGQINKESNVSRYAQQNDHDAVLDVDGNPRTISADFDVSQYDTDDRGILDTLRKEKVIVQNIVFAKEGAGFTVQTNNRNRVIEEIIPTTNLTKANKIHVKEDHKGHVFLFDYTTGNERTFLKHPSNTYWTIDSTGNYGLKTVKNYIKVVEGSEQVIIAKEQQTLVKEDRRVNVKGVDYLSVVKNQETFVGSNRNVIISAGEHVKVGKNRVSIVEGTEDITIKGVKKQDIGGVYITKVHGNVLFDTKSFNITCDDFNVISKSNFKERTNGSREISSDLVLITGNDGLTFNTGANLMTTVVGTHKTVVSGIAIPPSLDTYTVEVMVGNHDTDIKLGKKHVSAKLGIEYESLLSSLTMMPIGSIELKGILSSLILDLFGEAKLAGAMGSVNCGLTSTEIDHMIQIKLGAGASTEPVVHGMKMMTLFNSHMHPTGTGPSGPPMKPMLPLDMSMKVFVE